MVYEMKLNIGGISDGMIPSVLESKGIQMNDYARIYMNHQDFQNGNTPRKVRLKVISLHELGYKDGATFSEIIAAAQKQKLYPCSAAVGAYLRLHMTEQKESNNSILSGTHETPEGAITVISHPLEKNSGFPRGLYLRNVDGTLWLRGYICDDEYRWKPADVFAFEMK